MNNRFVVLSFLLSASVAANAQLVSLGVKGGVPLNDAFESVQGNSSSYVINTKRYTVGPTIEFHLPARLSIEVDALYTRLGFDNSATVDGQPFYSVTRANSWQFPVLGKFEITPGPIRPFIDFGATFRNISGLRQVRSVVSAGTLDNVTFDNAPEFNKRNDIGLTFGAGIAFKAGRIRLSPEFRYTRWGGENFRDPVDALLRTTRNQGTFLVGFTF
jgi:opacity protein-like surface antigen